MSKTLPAMRDAPSGETLPPPDGIPAPALVQQGRPEHTQPGWHHTAGRGVLKPAVVWASVVALLALLGWSTHSAVRQSIRSGLDHQLRNAVSITAAAVALWVSDQTERARAVAAELELREAMTRVRDGGDGAERQLSAVLSRFTGAVAGSSVVLFDREGVLRGSVVPGEGSVARPLPASEVRAACARVFEGRAGMIRSEAVLDMPEGRTDARHVLIAVPVKGENGETAAALMLPVDTERASTHVLRRVQFGGGMAGYLLDREGTLISEPAEWPSQHKQNRQIRDPGGDLARGHRPSGSPEAWPLTRMATAVTAGDEGVDLDGYRDHRGVRVVGAWRWIPQAGIGVAVEVPEDVAYRSTVPVRGAFWVLYAIVVAAAVGLTFGYSALRRLQVSVQGLRQLGQYRLIARLGQGGMGEVFLARHAMLRRPCALKILKPGVLGQRGIELFEKEVQLTSELTHPNVIQVYDYGRAEAGVFYYVMEYIQGITLEELVRMEHEVIPSRAVHILRQVCAALSEAHAAGLVHRDLKPANIMVCRSGSRCDAVKVLDFGLVQETSGTGNDGALCGTLGYIPPERLHDPSVADARVDVYAIGVIAFRMLSGREPFCSLSLADLRKEMTDAAAPWLNAVAKQQVPEALGKLVADCLERDPECRPQSIGQLLQRLDEIAGVIPWTAADAANWWRAHPELPRSPSADAGADAAFFPLRR